MTPAERAAWLEPRIRELDRTGRERRTEADGLVPVSVVLAMALRNMQQVLQREAEQG
jgi:hypothetical protein